MHEDIKLGYKSRDEYISNYKSTLKNLSGIGFGQNPQIYFKDK